MESKIAQVQQLPPPPKPPILLEIEQARQDIQELRQGMTEIKKAIGNLAILIKMSAAPRPEEISQALQPSLEAARKVLQSETQKIVHIELEAALQLLRKRFDNLSAKITASIQPQKKGLFSR